MVFSESKLVNLFSFYSNKAIFVGIGAEGWCDREGVRFDRFEKRLGKYEYTTPMGNFLLVPIHLDALHLKNGTSVAEAMVEFNRLPYFRGDRDVNPDIVNLSESIVSQPFQNRNLYLKPGIHLHWALPDALTKQSSDGNFPTVPNRWLITRKRPGTDPIQWVVESDYLHPATDRFQEDSITYPYRDNPNLPPFRYLGRKLTLEDWVKIQSGNISDKYLERLTAVGYGEPTFAAFYPNCRSVFGFYDPDFTDSAALSDLTYDVIGWYSQEQDYLSEFFSSFRDSFKKDAQKDPTPENWIDAIEEELKWKILPSSSTSGSSTSNDQQPERVEQRKARIDEIKKELTWQETLNQDSFTPQVVCFSRLTFNPKDTTEPSLAETVNIKLAVANTGTEALSAYLAEIINPSQKAIVEEQIEALQLAETLEQQQLDTGFKFEELRHEAGFNAVAGGSLWKIQLDTDKNQSNSETTSAQTTLDLPDKLATLLNALNQTQQNYDSAWAKIISRRRQLFSDWYKYMVSTYPPEGSLDKYPDIDDVKEYIEQQRLKLIEEKLAVIGQFKLENQELQSKLDVINQFKSSVQRNEVGNWHISSLCSDSTLGVEVAIRIILLVKAIKHHNEQLKSEYDNLEDEKKAKMPHPPKYVLERGSSARYWEPKEPVVLLVGKEDEDKEAIKASLRHGEDGRSNLDGLLNCYLLALKKINEIEIGKIRDKQFVQVIEQIVKKLDELQQANSEQIGFSTWDQQPWNPILLEWLVELFPVTEGSNKNSETNYNYRDDFITKNYSLETNAVDLSPSSSLPVRTETSNRIKIDTEFNIYSGSSILTPYANSLLQKRIEEYLGKHKDTGEDSLENPVYRKFADYETLLRQENPERNEEIENYLRQKLSTAYPEYDRVIRFDDKPPLGNPDDIKKIKQWYEENKLDKIPHPVATAKQAQAKLQTLNCLSQALGGFNQALLMHKQTLQLLIEDPIGFEDYKKFTDDVEQAVAGETKSAPQPLDDFNPIRSGEMRIIDLQLIDTFGQVRNLEWKDASRNESVIKPESLKASAPNRIALPPRFVQPCRINFRWLSAKDHLETNDHPATSPICGWIVPNNLNDSLMIYDSDGQALGSINTNAEWDYAPGEGEVDIEQIANSGVA